MSARGAVVGEALRVMTAFDVRWACDVLRPVYDATDGVDGRVSIEVDPRLAHDTEATIAEARYLWWLVDRPNLFIKIPAARQGLPAPRRGACPCRAPTPTAYSTCAGWATATRSGRPSRPRPGSR